MSKKVKIAGVAALIIGAVALAAIQYYLHRSGASDISQGGTVYGFIYDGDNNPLAGELMVVGSSFTRHVSVDGQGVFGLSLPEEGIDYVFFTATDGSSYRYTGSEDGRYTFRLNRPAEIGPWKKVSGGSTSQSDAVSPVITFISGNAAASKIAFSVKDDAVGFNVASVAAFYRANKNQEWQLADLSDLGGGNYEAVFSQASSSVEYFVTAADSQENTSWYPVGGGSAPAILAKSTPTPQPTATPVSAPTTTPSSSSKP